MVRIGTALKSFYVLSCVKNLLTVFTVLAFILTHHCKKSVSASGRKLLALLFFIPQMLSLSLPNSVVGIFSSHLTYAGLTQTWRVDILSVLSRATKGEVTPNQKNKESKQGRDS